MRLIATAGAVLRAASLPLTSQIDAARRDPQPVAFMRRDALGAVLFNHRIGSDRWMAIMALLERVGETWDEIALVHKPWWDPAGAFDEGELMLTGGHSRFTYGSESHVVLVAGQAAARTSLGGADGEIVVHPPWGHFIYLAEIVRPDEPVTLTARRDGVEQTAVFEALDID